MNKYNINKCNEANTDPFDVFLIVLLDTQVIQVGLRSNKCTGAVWCYDIEVMRRTTFNLLDISL